MTVGLRAEVEWQAVILEKVLEYVPVQELRVGGGKQAFIQSLSGGRSFEM